MRNAVHDPERTRNGETRISFLLASILAAFALAACATSPPLQTLAAGALDDPALAGTRWGMVVTRLDGKELVSIRPDDRFVPASNTKIFTSAAAFHTLGDVMGRDPASGTSLRLEPHSGGEPHDLVLVGGGDATLGDTPDCRINCLSHLANATAASGVDRVRNLIADDTLFPDERWSPGWSWNNLALRSGAAVSALVVNDNILVAEVRPGETAGDVALVSWRAGDDYMSLASDVTTSAEGETDIRMERLPGAQIVRLHGVITAGSPVQTVVVAADDPAHFAAWRLKRLLETRGVTVTGDVRVRHRPPSRMDDPDLRGEAPPPVIEQTGVEIARLIPPPLLDDLTHISKASQNLHAEILLRRLGLISGGGSAADGLDVIHAMLAEAGVERSGYDLADGSGMSTYNRISPSAMATFLLWTTRQAWGEAWRKTLPVGGVDGTLARRFAGGNLEGRVFAKTGTLNGVNALSGFLLADSGDLLAFSTFANDRPFAVASATKAIDTALIAIAAAN